MNKNRKSKKLTYDNQFRTLSIKVYEEQMPKGWGFVQQNIKVMDKSFWQVLAICHDRDPVGDDFWKPSIEKPHYHIIIRVLNNGRARVKQALDALGILFREEVDKTLWENHGVESCANFTNMAVYLTHETDEAINDCKTKYELFEFVSNISLEEIKQVREGYTRVSDSLEKVTPSKLAELDLQAYELGRNLGDFDRWYGSQPFSIRSHAKMRTIRESYDRGKNETIQELKDGRRIPRLCVYIQSEKGMGKSHAAEYALQKLGVRYLNPSGGGTGKFDKLEATHGGIILDDDTCPHLLQMADTKCYDAYKRGSGNPPWCGEYLIVTNNNPFDEWLEECGFKTEKSKDAARDRFYICELKEIKGVGRHVLYCTSRANRGGDDALQEIDEKFKEFKRYYDESLAKYFKSKTNKERIDINATLVTPEEEEIIKAEEAKAAKEAEAEAARQEAEEKKKAEEEERKERERKEKELYNKARKIWRDRKGRLPFEYALNDEERAEIRKIKKELEEEEENSMEKIFSIV